MKMKNEKEWSSCAGRSARNAKKDMKNLNTYLKSAKFKDLEKYNFKIFGSVEKNFFLLHFSSSFLNFFQKIFTWYYPTHDYLFNEHKNTIQFKLYQKLSTFVILLSANLKNTLGYSFNWFYDTWGLRVFWPCTDTVC